MKPYTEKRPEAIVAIKKAIDEKWNLICMGCVDIEPSCSLCEFSIVDDVVDCKICPLFFDGDQCSSGVDTYTVWAGAREGDCDYCDRLNGGDYCDTEGAVCPNAPISWAKSANAAEAMLEALVQLLPPEHRKEYGG